MFDFLKKLFKPGAPAPVAPLDDGEDTLRFAYIIEPPTPDCFKEIHVSVADGKANLRARYEVLDTRGDLFDSGWLTLTLSDDIAEHLIDACSDALLVELRKRFDYR